MSIARHFERHSRGTGTPRGFSTKITVSRGTISLRTGHKHETRGGGGDERNLTPPDSDQMFALDAIALILLLRPSRRQSGLSTSMADTRPTATDSLGADRNRRSSPA